MMTFETAALSPSEQFTLALIRERGAAVIQGAQPCAGKGGCGKTCVRRAATIVMSLLAADSRRIFTLHKKGHGKVSADEMSLLCLTAACQMNQESLSKALTLWLVPPAQSLLLLDAVKLLAEVLANSQRVLPLRFMAPPSRRETRPGFYALSKPVKQTVANLPLRH